MIKKTIQSVINQRLEANSMSENSALYSKSTKEVFEILDTNDKGLSKADAQKRLKRYGKNQLITSIHVPIWLKFLLQFKDVLVIMLVVAGVISFTIGNFRDGSIMFVIVFINAVIGYFQ